MDMDYNFNEEGILEVQQIKKCDLAFFYHVTPQHFRKEIADFFISSFKKRYYTNYEVQKIFQKFGPVTVSDVETAQSRIEEYKLGLKKKYLK